MREIAYGEDWTHFSRAQVRVFYHGKLRRQNEVGLAGGVICVG